MQREGMISRYIPGLASTSTVPLFIVSGFRPPFVSNTTNAQATWYSERQDVASHSVSAISTCSSGARTAPHAFRKGTRVEDAGTSGGTVRLSAVG